MAATETPFFTIFATTISCKFICVTSFKYNFLEETMLIDSQKTSSNYHHGSVKEALLNAALLVWTQLHRIVTLRNSELIGAAAIHQN